MGRFTLFTADKSQSFSLDCRRALAAEPSGLGNAFTVSYKETTDEKYMTNIKPAFEPISLTVYFNADGSDGYANYKAFLSFLAECGGGAFLFQYADGVTTKYCDVVLTGAPKSEVNEEGIFAEAFTFDRLSYWYENVEETFALKSIDTTAVAFPLAFPFKFSGKVFNNEFAISNGFYKDVPIVVKISGAIRQNIRVYIKDKATGGIVGEVALSRNSDDKTTIIIDAVSKKISVDDGGTLANGYGLTDKTKQSFLYLPHGDYVVGANITQDDAGEIAIAVKRYLLD